MKRILLSLVMVCWGIMATAQENGLNPIYQIKVNDLEYNVPDKKVTVGSVLGKVAEVAAGRISDTQHQNHIPNVNAKVKAALTNVRRMVALENSDAYIDIEFSGDITNIGTTTETRVREYKDSKGKIKKETIVRYEAIVAISITMTWLPDGVTKTQSFTGYGYSDFSLSTAEKALKMAIDELGYKVTKFYNTSFPISANIVERGAEKKDKQKELFIDVGDMNEITRDMHFNVYIIGEVAGRETRKQVGRLVVNEVLGDDITLCKVQSGGKDIKAALDEGKRVLAISKD